MGVSDWSTKLVALVLAGCGASVLDEADDTDDTVVHTDTDDTDDTDDGGPRVEVVVSDPVVCAAPAERASSGPFVTRFTRGDRIQDGLYRLVGGGVLMADLTGDDRLDVVVAGRERTQVHVQLGTGGFSEEGAARLDGVDLSWASAVSAADVEGDGDLDLLVARWTLPPVLLLNDGTGGFVDGTRDAGLDGYFRSQAAAFGDMDADGDLDLFVGNYGPHPEDAFAEEAFSVADPSCIWRNEGDGTFVEASEPIPPDLQDAYTFSAAWIDADGDRRQDLVVINDFGWARPNRILWNREGGLVPDDGSAQFDIPFAGMGLGVGDFNHDGVPDFVQSSWRTVSLLQSWEGRPVWFEAAESRGLVPDWEGEGRQIFGWGTEVVDLDLDGDDDVLMNFGYWDEHSRKDDQADALFVQQPDGTFVDEAAAWGLDHRGAGRGIAVGDLNDDGWPDVVKSVLGEESPMHLSRCGEGTWLRVVPRAPSPNTRAIGAVVRVRAGEQVWTRWILGGGTGMYGASPPEAHVGLGGLASVDDVEITWPDGFVSHTGPVEARRIVRVTRTR